MMKKIKNTAFCTAMVLCAVGAAFVVAVAVSWLIYEHPCVLAFLILCWVGWLLAELFEGPFS